jgi:hypothetical protein
MKLVGDGSGNASLGVQPLTAVLEKLERLVLPHSKRGSNTLPTRCATMSYKVCGSCAETQATLGTSVVARRESVLALSRVTGDKYGYSAQHSALVFVPVTAR